MIKNNDSIDLLRVFCAILVVGIHTDPFGRYQILFSPIERTAVPIFFIMSSYFLFKRLMTTLEKNKVIMKFVKKNLLFYITWFIVLFPITWHMRDYYHRGFKEAIVQTVYCFLFDSTFRASWFVMALIIGTLIVYYCSSALGNNVTFLLGMFCYIICVISSNYIALNENFVNLHMFTSFPVSIIWIFAGKMIAEKEDKLQEKIKSNKLFWGNIIAMAILYFEMFIIHKFGLDGGLGNDDCYFMLLLVCPALFLLFLNINIFAPFLRKARNTTKVWYCSHASISYLIYLLLGMNGYYAITCIPVRCAIFALVLAIGVLATILIEKLKEKTGWQFFYYMLGESANRRKDKQSYSLR